VLKGVLGRIGLFGEDRCVQSRRTGIDRVVPGKPVALGGERRCCESVGQRREVAAPLERKEVGRDRTSDTHVAECDEAVRPEFAGLREGSHHASLDGL